MKTLSRILIASALAAVSLAPLASVPAKADAHILVCAATESGKAEGPRRLTNPNTTTSYVLNSQGCAVISSADAGWFYSQGFTPGANLFSIAKTGITAQDFASLVLPAGAYVHNVVVQNTTANAVTGGIKVGTTAGGTDVVAALTCGANCYTFVADASLLKRVFSATASQTLSIDAVTAWNSASVDVTVFYSLR